MDPTNSLTYIQFVLATQNKGKCQTEDGLLVSAWYSNINESLLYSSSKYIYCLNAKRDCAYIEVVEDIIMKAQRERWEKIQFQKSQHYGSNSRDIIMFFLVLSLSMPS